MWALYQQTSAWGLRPSKALHIAQDEWAAYQFDYAVLELGRWVETGLREEKPLEQLLTSPAARAPRRFASLKAKARGQRPRKSADGK